MKTARILFQFTRLGWPGALGAGLLLAALVADLLVNLPLEDNLAIRQASAARRALLPQAAERVRKPLAQPRESEAAALQRLFAAARHHGLSLDEGRYAQARTPAGPAGSGVTDHRLSIDLPLSGSYPALRGFLAEVLDDNPALVLENLELRRDDIAATQLDARLRFALNLETRP